MDMCMDMSRDMCMDVCIDMRMDMSMDMCTDMCMEICTEMCIEMCMDMCIDLYIDMYIDMHIDMYIDRCTQPDQPLFALYREICPMHARTQMFIHKSVAHLLPISVCICSQRYPCVPARRWMLGCASCWAGTPCTHQTCVDSA